jgi:selenocysteine lyase/cysteine desulfurase
MTQKSEKRPQFKEIPRRDFLRLAGGAALGGGMMALSGTAAAKSNPAVKVPMNAQASGFWGRLQREFVLDPGSTYMNTGTTGSMPRDVLRNYRRYSRIVAQHPWDMKGEWGGFPYTTDLVARVAPHFGADPHEIVLSRNTTDGMCSIIEGLNLQPGDEVLYAHHEHVAAESPLYVVQQRLGITLTPVEIPVLYATEQGYVDAFANAVTPETRLIVFSHITYKTGARLPAERICKEVAIPNEIPTLIDGAHTIGMIELDFHAIDCDFYAGSGHKWQCGPGATGILYVRDNLSRLKNYWGRDEVFWPVNSSLAEFGFFGLQTQLQYIGNDNYPAKRALADVCDLWGEIGRDHIEARVLDLSAYCKELLEVAFNGQATLFSPDAPELSSGLTAFNPFPDLLDGTTLATFRNRLREEYGYIIRTTNFHVGVNDKASTQALRVSTHIFNSKREVKGLVEAMLDLYLDMTS